MRARAPQVCAGAYATSEAQPEPLCIKARRLSGWLRLLYLLFVPFCIASAVVLLIQLGVRRHQERQKKSLEAVGRRLRAQREALLLRVRRQTQQQLSTITDKVGRTMRQLPVHLSRQGTSRFGPAVGRPAAASGRASGASQDGSSTRHSRAAEDAAEEGDGDGAVVRGPVPREGEAAHGSVHREVSMNAKL